MSKEIIDPLPLLLTDTREQTPLAFTHLPSERAALQSGDYSARGLEDTPPAVGDKQTDRGHEHITDRP